MYRETLVSSKVIEFMEEKNILIWSGNIWDSEANKGFSIKKKMKRMHMTFLTNKMV
jgi:hypothetical protein